MTMETFYNARSLYYERDNHMSLSLLIWYCTLCERAKALKCTVFHMAVLSCGHYFILKSNWIHVHYLCSTEVCHLYCIYINAITVTIVKCFGGKRCGNFAPSYKKL